MNGKKFPPVMKSEATIKCGLSEYIFARLSRRSTATLWLFRTIIGCPRAVRYIMGPIQAVRFSF
jgi:hypothetical protein